jgi:hypothetical protein
LAAESLREDLVALDGVAEAEIDESIDAPSGVRVRLEPDADPRLVGMEVTRVLATHGLRSKITGRDDPFVDQMDEESTGSDEPMFAEPPPPPPPPLVTPDGNGTEPSTFPADAPAGLRSVAVVESDEGLAVTATAVDGETVTQKPGPSEDGLLEAVVTAVGALGGAGPVRVISLVVGPADDTEVVTVVVGREDGSKGAGAALVEATRAWAAGRAAWSALHG